MTIVQLPLGFSLRSDAKFENFIAGSNLQALQSVKQLLIDKNNFVYLWGHLASGRSHLLQAVCRSAAEYNLTSVYLPLKEYPVTQQSFAGLENIDLICLDDIECIAGNREAEEQVFHLFNNLRQKSHGLLVAANLSPMALPIQLADLKSRLSLGLVYQLQSLNDEDKLAALQLRANERGISLDETVANFLLRRSSRNVGNIFEILDTLDHASLVKQRRLTIPFVKEVLGL